jgi:hypothetical protein
MPILPDADRGVQRRLPVEQGARDSMAWRRLVPEILPYWRPNRLFEAICWSD